MKYELKTSGGVSNKNYDVVVIFETEHITSDVIKVFQSKVAPLLNPRDVGSCITRKIQVFMKDKKTVAIFYYTTEFGSIDSYHFGKLEKDCEQTIDQIMGLLELFEH